MERKFLEELGIEKDIIDKVLNQHSSEIGKYKLSAEKVTAERDGLRTQLDEASTAMQSYKDLDIDGIKKSADEWKAKYETDTQTLKAQIAAQDYAHSVNALVADVKFSSESAKKAFLSDLTAAKLPLQDGKLLGFADFKAQYESTDPAAFISESDNKIPVFTKNTNQPSGNSPDSSLRARYHGHRILFCTQAEKTTHQKVMPSAHRSYCCITCAYR